MTCAIVAGVGPNCCANCARRQEVAVLRRLRIGHLLRLRRQRSGITRLERDGERQRRRRRCRSDKGGARRNEALMAGQLSRPAPQLRHRRSTRRRRRTRPRRTARLRDRALRDDTRAADRRHVDPPSSVRPPQVPPGLARLMLPTWDIARARWLRARAQRVFARSLFLRRRQPRCRALGLGQLGSSPHPDPVDGRRGGQGRRAGDELVRPDPQGLGQAEVERLVEGGRIDQRRGGVPVVDQARLPVVDEGQRLRRSLHRVGVERLGSPITQSSFVSIGSLAELL